MFTVGNRNPNLELTLVTNATSGTQRVRKLWGHTKCHEGEKNIKIYTIITKLQIMLPNIKKSIEKFLDDVIIYAIMQFQRWWIITNMWLRVLNEVESRYLKLLFSRAFSWVPLAI